MPGGLASLAWTYESDLEDDKVEVSTASRFRNLGLGAAAASALVAEPVRGHVEGLLADLRQSRADGLGVTKPSRPTRVSSGQAAVPQAGLRSDRRITSTRPAAISSSGTPYRGLTRSH